MILNNMHPKALEPGCLVRFARLYSIVTQSPWGEGKVASTRNRGEGISYQKEGQQ